LNVREAQQLAEPYVVTEVRDRAAFAALEPEWDALVARTRDEPFYRHAFLRVWIDNFAPRGSLRVLTARTPDGRLVGALPLIEERSTIYGVPVRQLRAAANSHSCRFDALAEAPVEAAHAWLAHLRRDPTWDLLRLTDVPEGGTGWEVHTAAREAGLPVGVWESLRSPYLPLPRSMDALLGGLHSKFKANLRRRGRKLAEKGKVAFQRIEGGPALPAALEDGFALEQSGWKGARGTAIAQDPATRGFYTELARNAAYAGRLRLYFLSLDGRPVAFHFGLVHQGRYFLLKPGYDESLRDCSPGQLLMERVIEDCVASGLSELDFLGPDMIWKRDWTDRLRVHTWLYVFRDTRFGRALCAAKFRWAPRAKETVRRWTR
jgi:CelD/BcsL family acetyltransferase involved in cellulose biosynthesis